MTISYDRIVFYTEKVEPISTLPEAAQLDKYFAPPSQPTRRKGLLTNLQPFFSSPPWAGIANFTTNMAHWEFFPVIPARKLSPQNTNSVFVFAPAEAETITIDKWFATPSQPTYRKGVKAAHQPYYTTAPWAAIELETSTLAKWEFFPVVPEVVRRRFNVSLQPYFTTAPWAAIEDEVTRVDKWGFSPVIPQRRRPPQDTNYPFVYAPVEVETITIDKWFLTTSQPIGLTSRVTSFSSFFAPPDTFVVPIDRWMFQPVIPRQTRVSYGYTISEVASSETITIDKWAAYNLQSSRPRGISTQLIPYLTISFDQSGVVGIESWEFFPVMPLIPRQTRDTNGTLSPIFFDTTITFPTEIKSTRALYPGFDQPITIRLGLGSIGNIRIV